jgi:hypothetical protein
VLKLDFNEKTVRAFSRLNRFGQFLLVTVVALVCLTWICSSLRLKNQPPLSTRASPTVPASSQSIEANGAIILGDIKNTDNHSHASTIIFHGN